MGGEDGMIPLVSVVGIVSLTVDISGFSTDVFPGNVFFNFCCCFLLFLARNQESNAINISENPTTARIKPVKKRDLNKRIAANRREEKLIHSYSFHLFNHLTILLFYNILIICFAMFTKILIVTSNQKTIR